MNKSVIVNVNFLEFNNGVITVPPLHCLFQADQSISVQIKTEKVFHRIALNQMAVKSTVGLRDGQLHGSFPSSSVWTIFRHYRVFWWYTYLAFECRWFCTLVAPALISITVASKYVASTGKRNTATTSTWEVSKEEGEKQKRKPHWPHTFVKTDDHFIWSCCLMLCEEDWFISVAQFLQRLFYIYCIRQSYIKNLFQLTMCLNGIVALSDPGVIWALTIIWSKQTLCCTFLAQK